MTGFHGLAATDDRQKPNNRPTPRDRNDATDTFNLRTPSGRGRNGGAITQWPMLSLFYPPRKTPSAHALYQAHRPGRQKPHLSQRRRAADAAGNLPPRD